MAQKYPWSWLMAVPILLLTACTGGTDSNSGSGDTVRVSLQASYEKRKATSTEFSSQLDIFPARYCWAEVWRSGDSSPIKYGNLGTDGTGWVDIPRGINFKVRVLADITVPGTPGNIFFMHGSVKSGAMQTNYSSTSAFNQVPTWYMESLPQVADANLNVSLLARENPANADGNAGPFAIAGQMALFAEKTLSLEPTMKMPDLHAFWNTGNSVTAYPSAAFNSAAQPKILEQLQTTTDDNPAPGDSRPIYQHLVRYAGPSDLDRGADAYNDSLLQETFAHLFFSSGIIRSDNDSDAYVRPGDPSESTIAFASGFGNFISSAYRNDPFIYDIANNGQFNSWRVDQHQRPTYGGEFQGNSIARSMWGIWKNRSIFPDPQVGLITMWDATNPKIANLPFEFGNTLLACYPTYLVGLTRSVAKLGGTPAADAIRSELAFENIGNGIGDVRNANDPYYTTNPTNPLDNLWITKINLPLALNGTLRTYDSQTFGLIVYDQDQSQTYRFYNDGNNRTISLTSSGPGILVELFDTVGYLTYAQAQGSTNTISMVGKAVGFYAARVRLDPSKTFTNGNTSYTLTIQ